MNISSNNENDTDISSQTDTTSVRISEAVPIPVKKEQTSSDANLGMGLVRGKYMCNGITKEYAHVLMGHANVRSALASVKYLKFRICNDTTRCRQVIACEGCARRKARKKVSIFAAFPHMLNLKMRTALFTLISPQFARLVISRYAMASGLPLCASLVVSQPLSLSPVSML